MAWMMKYAPMAHIRSPEEFLSIDNRPEGSPVRTLPSPKPARSLGKSSCSVLVRRSRLSTRVFRAATYSRGNADGNLRAERSVSRQTPMLGRTRQTAVTGSSLCAEG